MTWRTQHETTATWRQSSDNSSQEQLRWD